MTDKIRSAVIVDLIGVLIGDCIGLEEGIHSIPDYFGEAAFCRSPRISAALAGAA
jgi:hypothetical protein